MLRLLLLVAIVAVVALIVFKLVKSLRGNASGDAASPPGEPPAVEDARLVRCTSCGAFVPREEALAVTDGYRCGEPRCREPPQ